MDRLLQDAQVAALEELAANGPTEHVRRRARILLMYHAGKTTREIAESVGLTTGRVAYWRREFRKRGMDIFPSPEGAPKPESAPSVTESPKAMKKTAAKPKAAKPKAAKAKKAAKPKAAGPKAAKPKAAKPKAAKPKAAKAKAAKPKAAKAKKAAKPKAAKSKAAKPKAAKVKKTAKPKAAPLSGGLLRKAEKVVMGVADVLGKKAIKQLDAITSQESFQEFVAYVRKQRKKVLKQLDAKGLKKKQIKFLRKQLKELEAQIAKAEKLLQKLED